jgi:twitching motility protein PilJ
MSFMQKLIARGRQPEAQAVALDAPPTLDDYVRSSEDATMRRVVAPQARHPEASESDLMVQDDDDAGPGGSEFSDTRVRGAAEAAAAASADSGVPFIGRIAVGTQRAILSTLLALGGALVLIGIVWGARVSQRDTLQAAVVGEAMMHSQRLAKASSQALVGDAKAFTEVRESADRLVVITGGLVDGNDSIEAASGNVQPALAPLVSAVERIKDKSGVLLAQEKTLTQVGQVLRALNRQSDDLLKAAEAVTAAKLQADAPATEVSAAGQLVMLTQRIGKSANEFLTDEGLKPEGAAYLLDRDLKTFKEISEGLLRGSPELKLTPPKDTVTRERLGTLQTRFEETRQLADTILGGVRGLNAARDAHAAITTVSEPLRSGYMAVQEGVKESSGGGWLRTLVLTLGALSLLGSGAGFWKLLTGSTSQRALLAEAQRLQAERQEAQAKRVNDANQAAILRLMNELQTVAEGDLTQQATVTEDITGAIADSINYTVEELRTLVAQVQGTVGRVTETTQQVEQTSTELLAASTEQLREIRETGESVLQMADRINDVSSQAQQTSAFAQQSLDTAQQGRRAVQNTIDGMNTMRDQIQDTSKRIKRLGESSQEIGEITELISDITEQTNVLALNAAIQAASAGEAGRGFTVVAEEVQRLAERSADATRQIASLVKTIQSDTQDAVAAMERSTQGVVESTRLADAAGTALADIDRASRQLSELIGTISKQALDEARHANVVASNIQHIFAVTEQTGAGTRSTAQIVRELSRTAEELKQSVARFKIS